MHFSTIFRITGLLLMIFSLAMLSPALVDVFYHENTWHCFLAAFLLTFVIGLICWLPFRKYKQELRTRDGFLITVLLWSVACLFGALPFMLGDTPHMQFTDALFESTSGLTTTGATVLTGLDNLPHAVLFYRQQLQFLGGMGIIVLAVAILPMLGVGGMQLYRTEMPGPLKDTKLTPRITETAKALWGIYIGLTLVCALSYHFAGMSWFDAIGESFTTVATGGFTLHDQSFAFYQNPLIESIAIVFMFLGGTNFALHFVTLQHKSLSHYWRNFEFRMYIMILLIVTFIIALTLFFEQVYFSSNEAVLKSLFNVVSLATTTGFKSAEFSLWPSYIPFLIMFVAIIGSCAGSTCGGIKIIRLFLLHKQSFREIKRLVHPHAILTIKFGGKSLPEPIIQAMWAFISTFVVLAITIVLLLMASGLDSTTAFGTLAATLANAGAGIGDIANGFGNINPFAKWVAIISMLAGRLEIFTLLVLFTPEFWKK